LILEFYDVTCKPAIDCFSESKVKRNNKRAKKYFKMVSIFYVKLKVLLTLLKISEHWVTRHWRYLV